MPEDVPQRGDERFCSNCGYEHGGGHNFCPHCGAAQEPTSRLEDPSAPYRSMPETGRASPSPPGQHPPTSATQRLDTGGAWVGRGMGIGLGACIVGLVIFVGVPLLLLMGCLALGAMGGAGQ